MESFSQLIGLWPSMSQLAADLAVPYGVVKQWRRRDSIPSEYWRALIAAAKQRGISGITADLLTELAARNGAAPAVPVPEPAPAPPRRRRAA